MIEFMSYQDFFQYGQTDIQRADKAFEQEDYQISAFFAQQAVEKHLKAYLLKNEIIDNLKNLGHLQLPRIVSELINYSEKFSLSPTDDYSKSVIDYLKNYGDVFNRLSSDKQIKIIFWKSSLRLPLDKSELKIIQGHNTRLITSGNEFVKQSENLASSAKKFSEIFEKIDTSKLNEKQLFLLDYFKKIPDMISMKVFDDFQLSYKFIDHFGWGSGGKTLTKKTTTLMIKHLKLLTCLKWMEIIVATYPHQEMSRYPFQIKDKIADEIYVEQKDDLKELLDAVKITCKEIRDLA